MEALLELGGWEGAAVILSSFKDGAEGGGVETAMQKG